MNINNIKNTPLVSGIDALYYFAESGGGYDKYYENITEQIETKKAEFNTLNYDYVDNDIIITINDIDLKYSGTARDGFLWFNHEFFRVGFKDAEKAQNIHNIRIQLNAIGIYTIGIKSQIEYINTKLLDGALLNTKYFPVTRIDVNMFIQHDFKYLTKEMILSKKKNHSKNIGERSSGYELETYYIGKNPFMLRIYNKMKELTTVSQAKKDLMYNYFGINGLDVEKPIFNIEFELHREFLKKYGIDTIEDALSRSKSLFEMGCDLIKVLDISKLTEKQIYSSNRKLAPILPIWEHISKSYDNKEFMQIETLLEKIEKITYRYSLEDARKPIKRQIKRLLLHDNTPTMFYFYEIWQNAKEEFEDRNNYKEVKKEAIKTPITYEEDLSVYSDEGLMNFEEALSKEMIGVNMDEPKYDELLHIYSKLHDELNKRNLIEFPF